MLILQPSSKIQIANYGKSLCVHQEDSCYLVANSQGVEYPGFKQKLTVLVCVE